MDLRDLVEPKAWESGEGAELKAIVEKQAKAAARGEIRDVDRVGGPRRPLGAPGQLPMSLDGVPCQVQFEFLRLGAPPGVFEIHCALEATLEPGAPEPQAHARMPARIDSPAQALDACLNLLAILAEFAADKLVEQGDLARAKARQEAEQIGRELGSAGARTPAKAPPRSL